VFDSLIIASDPADNLATGAQNAASPMIAYPIALALAVAGILVGWLGSFAAGAMQRKPTLTLVRLFFACFFLCFLRLYCAFLVMLNNQTNQ
jgi:F0F1-type ATP synthase membrane subunit c/vacuolar-type H+-ATPase subunit K